MGYSFFIELFLEWLPVSSSGHLQLISFFLPATVQPLLAIENYLGHIIMIPFQIVFLVYFLSSEFINQLNPIKKAIKLIFYCGIMTGITTIFYFLITFFKMFNDSGLLLLSFGFLMTTIFLYIVQKNKFSSKKTTDCSLLDACIFGSAQVVAFFPGISRFMVILLTASFLGYSRKASIEFVLLSNLCLGGGSLILFFFKFWQGFFESVIGNFSLIFFFGSLGISFLGVISFLIFRRYFIHKNIYFFIYYEFFVFLLSVFVYCKNNLL